MMGEPSILIIDDEQPVGTFFTRLLKYKGYRIHVAISGREAHELIARETFDVAMVDLKLPDADGLSLLQHIKSVQPQCEVIIMTGYSTTRTAVKAIQYGAFDYIEKPFDDISLVEELIEKALNYKAESSQESVTYSWSELAQKVGFIVGHTPKMIKLVSIAERIAAKDINVLIHGETGTGKEVLARFVHAASHRADKPFLAINCGALPENLLESELFGHEKGSFTGASVQRKGIFELANNGTLFLDEIGEASLSIQVKLLRVLETGEFLRVGGEKPVKTNVRIIAATNVDLEEAVAQKAFREDLFYRLDVVRLLLPPLRERKEDIPALVEHFIQRFAGQNTGARPSFSPECMEAMVNYNWPGNIRELANSVEQALALCDGNTVLLEHLSSKISGQTDIILKKEPAPIESVSQSNNGADFLLYREKDLELMDENSLVQLYQRVEDLYRLLQRVMGKKGISNVFPASIQEIEARAIMETLEFYNGNVSMSARALGIGRNTLYRKAKEYNINISG
ncbi:two component, sigma54 specific, transcriptional regulator, Fis family [Desulfotomaculum nigrificans CO-1-SRB]|uniref:Stage 0 sporulation protein A homolog n=1 Tax=Desulfotomaculum nigrificans (strain DSM 14880 / VKM B-2319 / CO-1-SRB) TaxID=868595 RepID=F6B7F8_DESCC|nr:sigma-54 dependent transcriptional regulator [Desulfotomaculum nigrificans]AEF94512.1 two component, sigma54 specific, transcriptional regulator, Fis family [Desulfotomaculum nigrificans CO-1-SRB]